MNLFKAEVKFNFKSFLIWAILTGLLYFIILIAYPSLINSQEIESLMAMFPEELLKAFNMDLANISTASGWLATEGIAFYFLAGGLYASILGSTIVLKEESDKTIEFLYSKPVSKNNILVSKILCGVLYVVSFTIFVGLLNIIALAINNDLEFTKMALLLFTPIMVFLSLFFLSLFVATFLHKTKNATIISFALVFGAYFLQIISVISDKVEFLKYFTVFTFSDSRYILQNNSISLISLIIFVALIVISILFTFIKYNKKEYL